MRGKKTKGRIKGGTEEERRRRRRRRGVYHATHASQRGNVREGVEEVNIT